MRKTLILTAIAALALASVADAKSCKDAHGKFIQCPSAVAAGKNAATKANAATTVANADKEAATKTHKARQGAENKAANAEQAAADKSTAADKAAAKKDAGIAVAASKRARSDESKAAKAAGAPPHCSKGKPCGGGCIPKDKVCHK
ncbi:MAG TPA: hypothetical protein VGG68_15505 [Caulobacteraceae bacterium]|jgi:uncharacterized protein with WD repeat